jgi:hypothetical protein
MRLLAIPHANVLGLILFFKKNIFVWEKLKMRHPTPKRHVRNGSHFGSMDKIIDGLAGAAVDRLGAGRVHPRALGEWVGGWLMPGTS